jgi:hypothetical protein
MYYYIYCRYHLLIILTKMDSWMVEGELDANFGMSKLMVRFKLYILLFLKSVISFSTVELLVMNLNLKTSKNKHLFFQLFHCLKFNDR